jgi:hypothetical protein
MAMGESGKKVIFLYPPSVIDEVVIELSRNEYEVYFSQNHARLAQYLDKRGDCLVFANIDTAQKESEWESWFRSRLTAKNGTGYGIVSYNENKALMQKYLMDIGLSCGFVILKIGAAKATATLLKTLEANEARGQRKYVRSAAGTPGAQTNVRIFGREMRGPIYDISVVGMSVALDGDPHIATGQKIADFQLNLKGNLLKASAVLYGTREDTMLGKLHIFIFDPASMNEDKRSKIRNYVRRSLQDVFDKELQQY